MVSTRYSDQQRSKSRQKVMRLYKQWHRPISKLFIKLPYSIISRAASIDFPVRLLSLKKNQTTPRLSEHPPVMGEKKLFEDNQGATTIAEKPISEGRTKHIDMRYHFIRELVERKVLNIQYTESSNQHADILTKPLGLEAFARYHYSFLTNLPDWVICFVSFNKLKVGSCKGCFSREGVLSRKAGLSSLSYSQLLFEETAQDAHR